MNLRSRKFVRTYQTEPIQAANQRLFEWADLPDDRTELVNRCPLQVIKLIQHHAILVVVTLVLVVPGALELLDIEASFGISRLVGSHVQGAPDGGLLSVFEV